MNAPEQIHIVDSHTEGEPTRVVVEGGPDWPGQTMMEKRQSMTVEADWLRRACVLEPRGSEAFVGALLTKPVDEESVAGVLFFNNSGYLNMCVHGVIGVVRTLAHLGRIAPGTHTLDTPAGKVTCTWNGDHNVTVRNVPSYRHARDVIVDVLGHGKIKGDIAWGGNWFFIVRRSPVDITLENRAQLTRFALSIRNALRIHNITGTKKAEIDHIQLVGDGSAVSADARNFVLCPGGAYDRSPCGTGTSALLACLHADGIVDYEKSWRQAGILGTAFNARPLRHSEEKTIIPEITGSAHVNLSGTIHFHADDPFQFGIVI